jgi:hypothetical protein
MRPAAESDGLLSLELACTTYAARVTREWRIDHESIPTTRPANDRDPRPKKKAGVSSLGW